MLVSVDLGYGYTKAVSEKGRAMFPSVLCPAPEVIYDFGARGKRPGYVVEVRQMGSVVRERFLVGELALKDGRAAQYTLARERFAGNGSLLTLAAVAAALVGAEGRVELAFGVPLAYYRTQREEVVQCFEDQGLYVKVDELPERFVSFARVHVFPQAVGALFSAGKLPEEGLVGLVDVGYFTTDYLLVELSPQGVEPLARFMSSIEVGVDTAVKLFADAFRDRTGKPLTSAEARTLWSRSEVTFAGRKLELAPLKDAAREAGGQAVARAVQAAWAEKVDFLDRVLLAGGGALEFGAALRRLLPAAEVLDDPLYANALGFVKLAQKTAAAAAEES